MRYYWITNINEFIKLKDDWDKALKTSKADRPYLLSDLIITWWDIYKKGKRLQIFILMNEQDVIVAGFPLYIMRSHIKKGGFRRIMQIGDGFANYTEPFYSIDVNLFRKFFIMAINELRGWEIIFLPSIKSLPPSISTNPTIHLISTDLPVPDCPSIARFSPLLITKLISRNT